MFSYKNFTEFEKNYLENKEFLSARLYCETIYKYFKTGKMELDKYYKYDNGIWMLDKIGKTDVSIDILNKLPKHMNKKYIWKDLYIDIVENYFYLYKRLEEWMNMEFDNLYNTIYYTFNIILYLKNKGYNIVEIPDYKHSALTDRGEIFRTVFNDNIRRI